MSRSRLRIALLSSTAALVLALAPGARAQTTVGGGASLPSQDYAGPAVQSNPNPAAFPNGDLSELQTANTGGNPFLYYYASSGRGQTAFSTDNAGAFQFPGVTSGAVDYAASDAFLATQGGSTTVNGYTYTTVAGITGLTATYPLRAGQDGALIQVPMLAVGIAVPAGPGKIVAGNAKLTDDQICGIYSGVIKTWTDSRVSALGLTGNVDVYYRADSSGTTFLFTNHLKAVCTTSNSSAAFAAALSANAPTTSFAKLFANYVTVGSNTFVPTGTYSTNPGNVDSGQVGNGAVATALAGTVTASGGHTVGTSPDSLGTAYLSPDFTAASADGQANVTPAASTLLLGPNNTGTVTRSGFINSAALTVPTVNGVTLTPASVTQALSGTAPPTGTAQRNPLNWVPSVPKPSVGYPISGYTNWELAQCYSNPTVAQAVITFLTNHYTPTSNISKTEAYNGFGNVSSTFKNAIKAAFLTGSNTLGISVAGTNATNSTCRTVTGR